MKSSVYKFKTEETLTVFEFISEGPKGKITKIVKFNPTTIPGFYNLTVGDKNLLTNGINDKAISDNGDTDRVLATIISAIYAFTTSKKEAWVYAIANTKSRARFYRMGINKYFSGIQKDFDLFGFYGGGWEKFRKEADYIAFALKRK
ncbi:hypothetical protein GVN16_17335 [Emticicia sp. CRIBPO]|uniref:DUF6934 family protein n=1 Tax=Emticicia sp. CRIBPO TaxID=2683258 RepID=UPI001413408E|nr:hypothetical protein [Emticicia sp. CRIBPO]NBA87540.1 hypothetical protein [Emticicia sp. CRIBPO]